MSKAICNRYIFSNTWYKVVGHGDFEPRKMAVGPFDMFMCGTDFPLYLVNETQPTDDGTVVTTNVCMRDGSNTCKKQYQIQILKCGSFFLYNLSRPETHDTAYCFGDRIPCSKPDFRLEPTISDKSVSRKVCVTSGYQTNCSCVRQIDIQLRNLYITWRRLQHVMKDSASVRSLLPNWFWLIFKIHSEKKPWLWFYFR